MKYFSIFWKLISFFFVLENIDLLKFNLFFRGEGHDQ